VRDVVLVHGLWVPAVVMTPLAARLRAQGYRCHLFGYAGQARPLERHAERLARLGREIGPAHYVGHSLGGLVILEALQRHPDVCAGNIVLMGTPARGNFAARRFAQHALGRWFLGASEPLWREGRAAQWTRPEPLGVVAGTLPLGLGRMFGPLHAPNDGVVHLDETKIEGMRERIELPVGHSVMLVSGRVATQVVAFLAHARFARPH
jgi:pimeloyl-ACP methyl ester carboxylesterase